MSNLTLLKLKHSIGAVVFLFVLIRSVMVRKEFSPGARHPSDAALIMSFDEHRSGFDRLIKMASEDQGDLLTIYNDQVMFADYGQWPRDCDACVSSQRWNEYQTVFANLGELRPHDLSRRTGMLLILVSFCSTEPDDSYEYIVSEKGYAYSPTDPPGLVESLNGMGFESKGTFYKKIADHWYLYHEWSVGKPE